MITKEEARTIYNLYSQIEQTNTAIVTLKKVAEEYEKKELQDVIHKADKYDFGGSIKMEIPSWMLEKNSPSGYSSCHIYDISVGDAILVLENHVVRLQKQLDAYKEK